MVYRYNKAMFSSFSSLFVTMEYVNVYGAGWTSCNVVFAWVGCVSTVVLKNYPAAQQAF
jgi:hypothetical protein